MKGRGRKTKGKCVGQTMDLLGMNWELTLNRDFF